MAAGAEIVVADRAVAELAVSSLACCSEISSAADAAAVGVVVDLAVPIPDLGEDSADLAAATPEAEAHPAVGRHG